MADRAISEGLITRLTQAARYVVGGQAPGAWFGPDVPVTPMAPNSVAGRRFDYPVGYNLNYTPRAQEAVTFGELRALADNCDILRAVIETRKDQMEALDWCVRLRAQGGRQPVPDVEQLQRIQDITTFLRQPDREYGFAQWLRQVLEDIFVLDAAAIYKRRNRVGGLYALEVVDAATIKLLLDESGRRPVAPLPAFQQVLKGIPAVDYTRDELLYSQRNPRSHRVYGYGPVEQVLVTVNILIRRALHQLEYYREGSQPDAFVGLPKEWDQEQILAFQRHFDAMLAGHAGMRRRVRFMPGDFSYRETKAPLLKDAYDEFLARIICFVFSVSPDVFTGHMNRATAQVSQGRAVEEGLVPLKRFVCEMMNRVIVEEFGSAELEFVWVESNVQDPKDAAQVNVAYVGAGILTVDEVRAGLGLEALAKGAALAGKHSAGTVKFNPYHVPAGNPDGGQFTDEDGAGGGSATDAVLSDIASYLGNAVAGRIGSALGVEGVQVAQFPPVFLGETPPIPESALEGAEEVMPPVETPASEIVKPPLDEYPTDPTQSPGPGYVWRGREGSQPGSKFGNYVNKDTGEVLRYDFEHEPPIEPHMDYTAPKAAGAREATQYRWYPDGRMEEK